MHKDHLVDRRVGQAKIDVGVTQGADARQWIVCAVVGRLQAPAKIGVGIVHHGEEQVRLVLEVEVDGRRRVADLLGHLAEGEGLVAVLQEQRGGGRQDRLAQLCFLVFTSLPGSSAGALGAGLKYP